VHTGSVVTLPVSRGLPAAAVVPMVTEPAAAAGTSVSVPYQPAVATHSSSASMILL